VTIHSIYKISPSLKLKYFNRDPSTRSIELDDLQSILLENAMTAYTVLKTLIEKQSISSQEKDAAEIALRFLTLINQSPQ
jgi:hypothetical protein